MAKEADNLPDLWALAQQLLQRLRQRLQQLRQLLQRPRQLLKNRASARTPQDQQQDTALAPDTGGRHPPARARDAVHSGWQRHQAPVPRLLSARPGVKSAPLNTDHTLAVKLRQRDFLRQAVVVNEILNKPLALRQRIPKPQRHIMPATMINQKDKPKNDKP